MKALLAASLALGLAALALAVHAHFTIHALKRQLAGAPAVARSPATPPETKYGFVKGEYSLEEITEIIREIRGVRVFQIDPEVNLQMMIPVPVCDNMSGEGSLVMLDAALTRQSLVLSFTDTLTKLSRRENH